MERLLCIKIASRGDLLLAAPAFRMLRKRRPNAFITLLVGVSCEDVARHLPYFDELRVIDDHALMGAGWLPRFWEARRFLQLLKSQYFIDAYASANRSSLKAEIYSEVFIFHRDWRYGLLTWLADIPIRRGFYSHKGHFFLTHPYRAEDREHHVQRYLGMVFGNDGKKADASEGDLNGVWRFADAEKAQALAAARICGFKQETGSWVALGFGGGHNVKTRTELKNWPMDHYRHLAMLLVKYGHSVVWVGDKEDARVLGDHFTGVNLAGKLSVAETAVILSFCSRVIANDTFTLHLAEAVDVPTIGLFGPTNPAHYHPLGTRSAYLWMGEKLACSPCHRDGYFPPCRFQHRCMTELTVESVLEKVEELK